jgi:ABC-type multidrug transport system ATPase subunit
MRIGNASTSMSYSIIRGTLFAYATLVTIIICSSLTVGVGGAGVGASAASGAVAASVNVSAAPIFSSLGNDRKQHSTKTTTTTTATTGGGGGLVWNDLSVISDQGNVLLDDCSGTVANGMVCGILGPSGAGKSSFLAALGGHQTLSVHGDVYSYHYEHDRDHVVPGSQAGTAAVLRLTKIPVNQVAWLQQKDNFFNMLTVEETLRLAAFLELPHLSAAKRQQLVTSHIDALGLSHAADRQIGDYVGGGSRLSGGERRRLSVALELLTEKQLVLADEPTSGLDSSMSAKVMNLMKELAVERDIPCLCAVHQPRSSIWHQLDSFILMAPGGKVCYAGDCREAVDYFRALGFDCPGETNPAEFFVDLVSVDTEDPVAAAADVARIDHLAVSFRRHQQKQWNGNANANKPAKIKEGVRFMNTNSSSPRQSRRLKIFRWIPRFGALLQRSWRQNIRNHAVNMFRLVASSLNAILLAEIFPTVRGPIPTVNSVADRVALLTFGAICLGMTAYMKTADLFAKEKPVVQREQTRHQYSALEYLAAKVFAEMPLDVVFAAVFATVLKASADGLAISWAKLTSVLSLLTVAGAALGLSVGSWAPNEQLATSGGIPLLVVLMVVGVINPSGVDLSHPPPPIVRIMKHLSPFKFAIEALCLGEYPGMQFDTAGRGWFRRFSDLPKMGGLAMVRNGDQVIEALGLANKNYWVIMKQLAMLSLGNLAVGWLGLLFQQLPKRMRKTSRSDDVESESRGNRMARSTSTKTKEPFRVRGKLRF